MGVESNIRFRNYLHPAGGIRETAFHLYVFDLHLRALIIKVMSVLESELQLQLGTVQTDKRFITFGSLRKRIFKKPMDRRQIIAESLGCRNPKELAAFLLQMNEVRNLAAHHARLWNRRFHFSIPLRLAEDSSLDCGRPTNNNSTAACLSAVSKSLAMLPPFLDLNSEFNALIESIPINRTFILENMGFEVP
jgi:abortive infection bacteriophage resistance protein